jgi:DNA uptake protein ComE-like DNA-binding protein
MTKTLRILLLSIIAALSLGVAQAKEPAKTPAASSASASATSPAAKPADQLVDINTATEKELADLPKIGEARAKAIVKGRPYSGKDDLLRKKIIPKDAYAAIKDKVIAKQEKKADDKKAAGKDASAPKKK